MKWVQWSMHGNSTSRGFWFRVFGYGLAVSDLPPLFSERYGFTRKVRIGRWGFYFLRK